MTPKQTHAYHSSEPHSWIQKGAELNQDLTLANKWITFRVSKSAMFFCVPTNADSCWTVESVSLFFRFPRCTSGDKDKLKLSHSFQIPKSSSFSFLAIWLWKNSLIYLSSAIIYFGEKVGKQKSASPHSFMDFVFPITCVLHVIHYLPFSGIL